MVRNTSKTRYGQRSGSGANEPKRHERKEQAPDWQPRQGGDQTRPGDDSSAEDRPAEDRPAEDRLSNDPRSAGKATRGKDEVATRRYLEGAEQGPM
jgi:hypothetical protein